MQFSKSLICSGRRAPALLAALALLGLAGCENDPDEKAPACPLALTRPDASSLTRYDGRGTDLTNLVLNARLTDVKGVCEGELGHKVITAKTQAQFLLTRGPAATSRETDLAYNVVVMRRDQILEGKQYVQHVVFPPNVDSVQVTGQQIEYKFTTQRGLTGPSYQIYFVLQLTPAELAANQAALHRR